MYMILYPKSTVTSSSLRSGNSGANPISLQRLSLAKKADSDSGQGNVKVGINLLNHFGNTSHQKIPLHPPFPKGDKLSPSFGKACLPVGRGDLEGFLNRRQSDFDAALLIRGSCLDRDQHFVYEVRS
jgi:hypothetical protein